MDRRHGLGLQSFRGDGGRRILHDTRMSPLPSKGFILMRNGAAPACYEGFANKKLKISKYKHLKEPVHINFMHKNVHNLTNC